MKKVLGSYRNGNYTVVLYDDGTKVRVNNENYMRADRPESIDINISTKCDCGCAFCYENCTPNGVIADFNSPLFDSIPPWTEIALNGNGVIGSVRFEDFLFKMARQKVICNITVNIKDYIQYINELQYCVDHGILWGIGVSINEPIGEAVISYLKRFPNVVVHVVAGIVPWETLVKLSNNGIKLLILGYKTQGRGISYIENHDVRAQIDILKDRLGYLYKHFKVVSFDNLALEQLEVKDTVDENTWKVSYMGKDGSATFFIDAVTGRYAKSSISPRLPIDVNDVSILFRRIQNGEDI